MSNAFINSLSREFEDVDACARLLNHYMNCKTRTGRKFETFEAPDENPNNFSAADFIAVALLSIQIRRSTKSGITPNSILDLESKKDEIASLMAVIQENWRLESMTELEFSQAQDVANQIREILRNAGIPRVARFKLMARKRPNLFAIRDTVVEKQLGNPQDWYLNWFLAFQDTTLDLKNRLEIIQEKVVSASHVSLLRVADIVIWERQQDSCQLDSCKENRHQN